MVAELVQPRDWYAQDCVRGLGDGGKSPRRGCAEPAAAAASSVRAEDFRGLRHLADRLGDDFRAGIVLYTGTQTLPFGPRLRAMPVSSLWEIGRPSFAE